METIALRRQTLWQHHSATACDSESESTLRGNEPRSQIIMQPLWRSIVADVEIQAKPQSPWTKVLDYVGPSRKLRLEATGTWIWQEASPRSAVSEPAHAVAAPSAQPAANTTPEPSGTTGGNESASTQQPPQAPAAPENASNATDSSKATDAAA